MKVFLIFTERFGENRVICVTKPRVPSTVLGAWLKISDDTFYFKLWIFLRLVLALTVSSTQNSKQLKRFKLLFWQFLFSTSNSRLSNCGFPYFKNFKTNFTSFDTWFIFVIIYYIGLKINIFLANFITYKMKINVSRTNRTRTWQTVLFFQNFKKLTIILRFTHFPSTYYKLYSHDTTWPQIHTHCSDKYFSN